MSPAAFAKAWRQEQQKSEQEQEAIKPPGESPG